MVVSFNTDGMKITARAKVVLKSRAIHRQEVSYDCQADIAVSKLFKSSKVLMFSRTSREQCHIQDKCQV